MFLIRNGTKECRHFRSCDTDKKVVNLNKLNLLLITPIIHPAFMFMEHWLTAALWIIDNMQVRCPTTLTWPSTTVTIKLFLFLPVKIKLENIQRNVRFYTFKLFVEGCFINMAPSCWYHMFSYESWTSLFKIMHSLCNHMRRCHTSLSSVLVML